MTTSLTGFVAFSLPIQFSVGMSDCPFCGGRGATRPTIGGRDKRDPPAAVAEDCDPPTPATSAASIKHFMILIAHLSFYTFHFTFYILHEDGGIDLSAKTKKLGSWVHETVHASR